LKVPVSDFLASQKPEIKRLVGLLENQFAYVSVLGTDVSGKSFTVRDKSSSVSNIPLEERGFVARVYTNGMYYEYSFNNLPPGGADKLAETIVENAKKSAEMAADIIRYPLIEEESATISYHGEVAILPNSMASAEKLARLRAINEKAHNLCDVLVDLIVTCTTAAVSKVFISSKKDLEQNYIISEAAIVAVVRRDDNTRYFYTSCSGLKGLEILDELESKTAGCVENAVKLLDAKPMQAGEYDVICGPDAVGIIAHEAFGHGVEMDMFVKNRAKAVEYLGKPVASKHVTMHDGAKSASHAASYLFDDEGTLGTDTVIIKDGILQTGISDLLSALKLGETPTGNGRRESFARKAYTRMSNTLIRPGNDKLDDMISSLKHGFLIESAESGMEDPKDWGIQCMFTSAREIIDGKLTGNLYAPVIMTGYVPELLSNITMVSREEDGFELTGAGGCGKGYKEWVKVSCGGPYIKTKARLG